MEKSSRQSARKILCNILSVCNEAFRFAGKGKTGRVRIDNHSLFSLVGTVGRGVKGKKVKVSAFI